MSEPGTSIGKQAKDIADAANTSVDAVERLAAFVDGMFGNAISNSLGLLSDKIAYYRFEKAIALHEAVDEKLRKRGVEKRYVPVAFGLPVIEKATVEDEPILREKWANLLANAQDATYDKPLRRSFTTMLADFEPIDAQIFDIVVRNHLAMPTDKNFPCVMKNFVQDYSLSENVVENSVRNLMRLGLIKPGLIVMDKSWVIDVPFWPGKHNDTVYKDIELFQVTELGINFFYAVNEVLSES